MLKGLISMTCANSVSNSRWEDGSYVPGVGKAGRGKGPSGYWNYWRREYNREHTGNPYPTHGLGPVCQALNIHRGDRMTRLVSLSSGQFGMTRYAAGRFGERRRKPRITGWGI